MIFSGTVDAIFVAPAAKAGMTAVNDVEARAGVGLDGDRYAVGAGTWSKPGRAHGQLTLIEAEAIAAAGDESKQDVNPAETRRNIVTSGVPLNHLIGQRFRVGEAVVEGAELCEPCTHIERLSGKKIRKPLVHRGGLNAIIVESGRIAVGDAVKPLEQTERP